MIRRLLLALTAAVALAAPAAAQTGILMPSPVFEPDTNVGGICAGCKLYTYAAGTTTPLSVWTDVALSVAHANPVVLDASGRAAAIYLNPTLSYKLTLKTSADVELWTRDNIIGPNAGVLSVTAANSRGIQVSRTSGDAGISLASSGGSGKTYGIVSNTSGGLKIQDDADGTPSLEFLGNNITASLTGAFTVSGGTLSATGLGTHSLSASGSGANTLVVRNAAAGSSNSAALQLGNDVSTSAVSLTSFSSTSSFGGNFGVLDETGDGIYIRALGSSGVINLGTGALGTLRMGIDASGRVTIGQGAGGTSSDFDVRSSVDGAAGNGGMKISRADGTYVIVNVDDGGASTAWGSIQAGDGSGFRPVRLSPSGGGIQVGGGGTILAIYTGSTTYDPPSLAAGASTSTTVTVTGASSTSVCTPGLSTLGTTVFLVSASPGTNQATVSFYNASGGTVDLSSGTLRVTCFAH